MADFSQVLSSSSSKGEKPVVVRVKRKSNEVRVDAFWLEINERPLKRPLLDFGNLSISDSSTTGKEELKTKKLLVQHVETVNSAEETEKIMQAILPNLSNTKDFKMKLEERRHLFKRDDQKQDQLRSVARQMHKDLVRNARFEQLWKSRKGNKESINDPIHEFCHLYDVVCVDVEEKMSTKRQELNDSPSEDDMILCNYMPLLREFLPTAAAEIESDMKACSSQEDGYVYDFYTEGDNSNSIDEDDLTMYPRVQVDDDDDYYDGPIQSEFESDDSNAEDNPRNDYPDEVSSEDEELLSSSNDQSEDDSEDEELESRSSYDQSKHEKYMYEEDIIDDEEEDDWRWEHR